MNNPKPKVNSLKGKSTFDKKALLNELLPLIKAFVLWIILVVIVAWDYTNKQWFSMIFVDFTTYLTYGLSKMMFIPAKILGDGSGLVTTMVVNYKSIYVNNYPMIIEIECSAYHAYIAMIALVIFSRWNIKQKLIIGSVLFATLAIINSLRIIMLGVIGKIYPQIFDIMHDYVWNILLVIVIWGLWELANKRMNKISQQTS
ncbi:MAG: exosortase/archaeosortase family protein [Prolixibacteraceae bacterium]|nr:exosortase/archaeosortase family protein [Prolixibacteraceae bacterium]